MTVRVITPPSPIVTTAEAKKHLIVEHPDDDVLIDSLIQAATAWLDGPAGWLGRSLGRQTLQLTGSGWPSRICGFWDFELPYRPVVDVGVVVTYLDAEQTEQTIAPANYRVYDGNLSFVDGYSLPIVGRADDAVRVQYEAGYEEVPAPIKVAIMMLVAQWYRNRTPIAVGAAVESLPFAVDALLSPYRVY